MREIELVARTTQLTKYTVDALAWATNRRGHNSWKSDSVIPTIYDYLQENNVDLSVESGTRTLYVNPHNITYTMKVLERQGFATLESKGKRFVHFEFKPDVILTGHSVRFKGQGPKAVHTAAPAGALAAIDVEVPLPDLPHVRYLASDIDRLLEEWSLRDPDAYAKYADKLLLTLQTLLKD